MRFSTGLVKLDEALGGGIGTGSLTLIYGHEKAGKTSLALRICASAAKVAPVAYVDCSGRLHPLRLSQVMKANNVDEEMVKIALLENFEQQEKLILKIYDKKVPTPLLIFDDVTHLHRIELMGNVKSDINVYRRLAFQAALLKETVLKEDVAVIIIGQVHDVPELGETRAVAHRLLTYWADQVLKIERDPVKNLGEIMIEKPPIEEAVKFRIANSGVIPP